MTESQIQQGLMSCARQLGYLVFHATNARQSEPGFPDLVVVGHGIVLVFELKTQRGRVRAATQSKRGRWLPGQMDWLRAFEEAGVPAFLVRPQATADSIGYDEALAMIAEAAGQEAAA